MASIYDKALKRKDFSGIVTKDAKKEETAEVPANGNGVETKESKRELGHFLPFALAHLEFWTGQAKAKKKQAKEKAAKADEPKAGADVGKIVNLMAGDANRVSSISMFMEDFRFNGTDQRSDFASYIVDVFHLWG